MEVYLTILDEVTCCDGPWCWLSALQSALGVFIPEEVAAITSISSERAVLLVEGDTIHSVDLAYP